MSANNGTKIGDNLPDLSAVKKCVKDVEGLYDQMLTARSDYMAECKAIREDMAGVYLAAKDKGVNVRAAKTLVVVRMLERRKRGEVYKLDLDILAAYNVYEEASEAWELTPLGKSAGSGKTTEAAA